MDARLRWAGVYNYSSCINISKVNCKFIIKLCSRWRHKSTRRQLLYRLVGVTAERAQMCMRYEYDILYLTCSKKLTWRSVHHTGQTEQEAQLSLTNRSMPVCNVVKVLQDFFVRIRRQEVHQRLQCDSVPQSCTTLDPTRGSGRVGSGQKICRKGRVWSGRVQFGQWLKFNF